MCPADLNNLEPSARLYKEDSKLAALQIPLASDASKARVKCSLWEWQGMAQDEGIAAATWLSTFLEKDVCLMRYIGET